MDPQLEEKVAFFECLKVDKHGNRDGDVLNAKEEAYRRKSRAFYPTAASTSTNVSRTMPKELGRPPNALSERVASGAIYGHSDPDIEIIAVTPVNRNSRTTVPNTSTSISVGNDTIIPETSAAPTKQPSRRVTRSTAQARHHSPLSDPLPVVRMGKRKKEAPLKLAPEAQRIFKGLSFYYIPNDDINPARKLRITKAREHGATWSRKLVDATHIIVDKKLTFADIERHLQEDPQWSGKVLVNENYPIDCLKYRILANPGQHQYEVTGTPTPVTQPANTVPPSDGSDTSLRLKPGRKRNSKQARVPTPSVLSDDESSSHGSAGGDGQLTGTQRILPLEHGAKVQTEDDELTQYISKVKAMGDEYVSEDGLEDDTTGLASPADEAGYVSSDSSDSSSRPRKRRTRSKNDSSKKNDIGWQQKFICMKGGTKEQVEADDNPNAETIKVLQKMLDMHSLTGDNFRIRAYRLAITTLRAQRKQIRTAEEARALPHIGRIADKIEEIVTTNRLRQLEYALDDPRRQIMGLFLKIHGVGKAQAEKWIAQGFRTLDDLRNKAELNTNQKIGLEHYDDLNTRIPRREVEALASCVKRTAKVIDPKVELIVGGSYRRGADSCGDIDFIVTKRGTSSISQLAPFLNRLVKTLTEEGFLTAALASHHGSVDDDGGSKWYGCCVLPKSAFPGPKEEYRPIWRRIDLLLVPDTEIGAALLYFTGNDIFNRSIRLLARRKGMRLNQKGLYNEVLRGKGGTRITEGTLLEGRDEKKIFAILGVRWREPHERWCG
ncbi:hypothetical protein F5Y04DRAFT_21188 [Hypomontagnella monticulosa]|nr:hypothetical protein F5Y04DRAFT_21188 [Hypomontagnella monticulosa]